MTTARSVRAAGDVLTVEQRTVWTMFRNGRDTHEIGRRLQMTEAEASDLLQSARVQMKRAALAGGS